jgi:2-dehydro-3-deoxygalactonokinase
MAMKPDALVLGIDWGTTHRRVYALDSSGTCVAEHADGEGALHCKGRFAASLAELLVTLQVQPQAVIMSGMVGSALGWALAPYLPADVSLRAIGTHLLDVPTLEGLPTASLSIVPGYCVRTPDGGVDVMRGEETQLLGATCMGHTDGWFVLPGTHSKWVHLKGGKVQQLRTYMTGELFNVLSQHGTLAAAAGGSHTWSDVAFAEGVAASQGGALSHLLFGCRARVVSGDRPAEQSQSYLSGLLIGAELHDVIRDGGSTRLTDHFKLIGSPSLAEHYQTAAALLGLKLQVLDARAAFLAAIFQIYQTNLSK